MEITSFVLGDLQTNCYLAWCEDTRQALIIDPADSGDFITDQILRLQLEPVAIVLTHGHFDHVLGLLEVGLNFPVPVFMHQADLFLIKNAAASARHWIHREVDPVPIPQQFTQDNDRIDFGHHSLTILETPGHTPGSICLYNQTAMFTGDTVFAEGVGRTDFRYSDPVALQNSISKIDTISPGKKLFPGHGVSFESNTDNLSN